MSAIAVELGTTPTARLRTATQALLERTAVRSQLPKQAHAIMALALDCWVSALAQNISKPERAARDMALAAGREGLDDEQHAIAACVVAFQSERIQPERELAFLRLSQRDQQRATRLAMVVRLGSAIAATRTAWLRLQHSDGTTTLVLAGPDQLPETLTPVLEQWCSTIGPLTASASFVDQPAVAVAADVAPVPPLLVPEVHGDAPAAEGARRMLRRFFERMLAREAEVRESDEVEAIHQMRVATRRLRASLQVAEQLFEASTLHFFRRELREVADALGLVRDSDVFYLALQEYQQQVAKPELIDGLLEAVAKERTQARRRLLADLKAKRYAKLKHSFAVFLTSAGTELADLPPTGVAPRLRDLAGSAIWRRYEDLRAFEVVLDGASDELLHQARISGKRLRYTLEFFEAALGPRTEQLLNRLADLQEQLGLLQDGAAARTHIERLGFSDDVGAKDYLAALAEQRSAALADLPRTWDRAVGATARRKLMELIVQL